MRIKLDLPITSKNIEELTGIRIGEKEEKIEFISTNSKDTDKSCLFIPLAKKQAERYAHIDESVKNGAKILADLSLKDNDPHNSVEAMLKLASGYKAMLPNLRKTVAITGSVGKTTTKEITKRIVSKRYRTHSTEGNQNNAIGLSYTILSAPRDTEILVTEIGMNHPGEIKELSSCLHPSIAIITEIGCAHIGNLLTKDAILSAKLEILSGLEDDGKILVGNQPELRSIPRALTVSIVDPKSDFFLFPLQEKLNCSVFDFYSDRTVLTHKMIGASGEHILKGTAFALAIASELKLNEKQIDSGLNDILPDNFRTKIIQIGKIKIYDDTYSSSPEALSNALKTVSSFYKKKSAMLGDMLELGNFSAELHFQAGKKVAEFGFNKLYLFGKESINIAHGAICGGMRDECIFINENIDDPQITANQILNSYDGEMILFKASRKIKAERIFDCLKV